MTNMEQRPVDLDRIRTTSQRVSRIVRVGYLWAFVGLIFLVAAAVEGSIVGVVLAIAWVGLGLGIATLAGMVRSLEERLLRTERRLAELGRALDGRE